MKRDRDSQRAKFWSAIKILGEYDRKLDGDEVERQVKRFRANAFLARRYPDLADDPLAVRHGGRKGSGAYFIQVNKPGCTASELVYLLARVLFNRTDTGKPAWYGWEFAEQYLDATRVIMGKGVHDLLQARMKALRVRYAPKAKRTVTPEMLERLAQARAKRSSAG